MILLENGAYQLRIEKNKLLKIKEDEDERNFKNKSIKRT